MRMELPDFKEKLNISSIKIHCEEHIFSIWIIDHKN